MFTSREQITILRKLTEKLEEGWKNQAIFVSKDAHDPQGTAGGNLNPGWIFLLDMLEEYSNNGILSSADSGHIPHSVYKLMVEMRGFVDLLTSMTAD